MSSLKQLVAMTAGILVLELGCAGNAFAVTVERIFQAGPTALCQSALPANEGTIRKRPLAVQNEGTQPAYVTCSYIVQGSIAIKRALIWSSSNDGTPKTITCTGVTGFKSGPNQYVVHTTELPASGVSTSLDWVPTQFTGGSTTVFPSSHFSLSCLVPPGAGLNQLQLVFDEDIGA